MRKILAMDEGLNSTLEEIIEKLQIKENKKSKKKEKKLYV